MLGGALGGGGAKMAVSGTGLLPQPNIVAAPNIKAPLTNFLLEQSDIATPYLFNYAIIDY
jgi:hypothetical protein